MAGGAGILAATLTAAIWALPARGERVSSADAATSAASASVAAQPRDEVEISVSAWPYSAMIFLDDRAVAGNPFKGRFPRDGELHLLRIEARGFEPRVEDIAFDRSRDIERALTKAEPEPPAKKPAISDP